MKVDTLSWLSTPELCSGKIYFERSTFKIGRKPHASRIQNGSCQCLTQQWFPKKPNSSGKTDGSSQWRLVFMSFFFVVGSVLSSWISEGKQALVSMFTQGVHSLAREIGPEITLQDIV